MCDELLTHFRKYIQIDDGDEHDILSFFSITDLRKKQNILVEGKVCRTNLFVVKGCLRLYFINENGTEQTTQFAIENWWMTDYTAFHSRQPSTFNIQAVEQSKVITIDLDSQEILLERFPQFERYFRLIFQRATAASQLRIRYLYELSHEELYNQFRNLYPGFVQRIPQYLLASFLGFSPEYLSEIRKRSIS